MYMCVYKEMYACMYVCMYVHVYARMYVATERVGYGTLVMHACMHGWMAVLMDDGCMCYVCMYVCA